MDKMVFLKSWRDNIMNNEYSTTTPEEMAYITYAAMVYCFDGIKIDIEKEFGAEYANLNRDMPNIYSQIDAIKGYQDNIQQSKHKYNDPRIKELAAAGKTQKEICRELGYDETKSRSLSTSAFYRRGREEYLQKKKELI